MISTTSSKDDAKKERSRKIKQLEDYIKSKHIENGITLYIPKSFAEQFGKITGDKCFSVQFSDPYNHKGARGRGWVITSLYNRVTSYLMCSLDCGDCHRILGEFDLVSKNMLVWNKKERHVDYTATLHELEKNSHSKTMPLVGSKMTWEALLEMYRKDDEKEEYIQYSPVVTPIVTTPPPTNSIDRTKRQNLENPARNTKKKKYEPKEDDSFIFN